MLGHKASFEGVNMCLHDAISYVSSDFWCQNEHKAAVKMIGRAKILSHEDILETRGKSAM